MNEFLSKPSTDFNAVRDGRASMPLWIDIDLSVARAISGTGVNAALPLNIAGNSFYIDQDTANVGTATVHFQDTNLGNASAPLFVSAGFIANVPFTQILIENTAQPGKRLRIFYGVDIDFQAGINASIAISGAVEITNTESNKVPTYDAGISYGASYQSTSLLAANTPEQVISPAANVKGVIIHFAQYCTESGNGAVIASYVAKSSAPANIADGDVIVSPSVCGSKGSNYFSAGNLAAPIKIPAGKGVYFISSGIEVGTLRQMKYTVL